MSMVTPGQHRTWIFRSSLRSAAAGLALAIMFVLTIGATRTVQAQTFQVIHNFIGGIDGAEPNLRSYDRCNRNVCMERPLRATQVLARPTS